MTHIVVYENEKIIIEHVNDDTYIVGYKNSKQRYTLHIDTLDFENAASWAFNFKPDAEIWTHYKQEEGSSRNWGIVRLYDDNGHEAHFLESMGDGRYPENDFITWYEAVLAALNEENELLTAYTIGFTETIIPLSN